MTDKPAPEKPQEEDVKKPSLLSQAVPYLFTFAILFYVFTGLSSNVVDERHHLSGSTWSHLKQKGARSSSLEVRNPEGSLTYCGGLHGCSAGCEDCPDGVDYEFTEHPDKETVSLRRCEPSNIPDGGEISVNYVKKVKLSEIWAMVKKADLRLFLPIMVLHTIIFFLADIFSFGIAYRWFNVPDMKLKEIMEVRGAPYVIQIGLSPLAEVLFPLYMWRVKRVPVAETMSSNIWTMIMDIAAIVTAITPAVAYNLFIDNLIPAVGTGWLVGCFIFWVLFFGNFIFWYTPMGRRTAARIAADISPEGQKEGIRQTLGGVRQLLRTFSLARWQHFFRSYLARFMLILSSLISSYVAMKALGMDPSLPLALIGIPLVVLSVFMPIGVGGYGGPQLIAWFLFVKMGQAGTADQVIAYSLLWSTGFLVGRAVIGLIFIRGFWRRCFPGGYRL